MSSSESQQSQPDPKRRALLLGAPAPDLRGVEHDLELMTEALLHHRFPASNIAKVMPATRADIVGALEKLVGECGPGDVVVIFYSGHGAKSGVGTQTSEQFPFVVPTDFEASTQDDFRGYTNLEFSLVLDALTSKTKNVTVIMDCCHAGRMFRADEDSQPDRIVWQDISRYQPTRNLSLMGRWREAAERHFQRVVLERRDQMAQRHAEANPFVVQLLASSDDGRAYETSCSPLAGCDHHFSGAMTLALHEQLMRVAPDNVTLTWQDIGRAVRMTPRRHDGDQRVSIEGPHRRRLFGLDEREELGAVDVDCSDGTVVLVGGRLLGLEVGDRFQLINAHPQEFLEEARVHEVTSSHARVTTAIAPGRLRPGAWALPLSHGCARAEVEITGIELDSPEVRLVRDSLEASGLVRVRTGPGALPLAARLEFDGGMVQLRHQGIALERPRRFDLGSDARQTRRFAAHLARCVHTLARRTSMEQLAKNPAGGLSPDWSISWSTVDQDRLGPPLSMAGEQLRAGQRFTIVCSDVKDRRYSSAFLLRVDGSIEWLSRSQGDGVEIGPGGRYMLGQRAGSSVGSVELRPVSPSIVQSQAPLPTSILIVVTDQPIDLRRWEQSAVQRFDPYHDPLAPPSSVRNILLPTPRCRAVGYHVHEIQFHTLAS